MARGFRSTQSSSSPRSLVLSETPASGERSPALRDRERKSLELVDARHIVRTVILAGQPHKGWRCEVCGYVTDPIYTAGGDRDPLYLVSQADLPPGKLVMIALGQRAELSLCVAASDSPNCERRRAWRELAALRSACWRSSTSIALPRRRSRGARRTRTCWRSARGVPLLTPRAGGIRPHTSKSGIIATPKCQLESVRARHALALLPASPLLLVGTRFETHAAVSFEGKSVVV